MGLVGNFTRGTEGERFSRHSTSGKLREREGKWGGMGESGVGMRGNGGDMGFLPFRCKVDSGALALMLLQRSIRGARVGGSL